MAKPPLGSGQRFAAIEKKAAASGARNPAAVAAAAGRKAHGQKAMTRYSKMGMHRAEERGQDHHSLPVAGYSGAPGKHGVSNEGEGESDGTLADLGIEKSHTGKAALQRRFGAASNASRAAALRSR